MMIQVWVWDWGLILGIKIKRLEFGDWEFVIVIGYWDWGFRLWIVIGDLDRRLRLGLRFGIGISDWWLGLKIGIGDSDWGLGLDYDINVKTDSFGSFYSFRRDLYPQLFTYKRHCIKTINFPLKFVFSSVSKPDC